MKFFHPHSIPTIIILIFVSSIVSCNKETENDLIEVKPEIRYLALGDSYTFGQGVEVKERFPHQVMDWLKINGVSADTPEYIAYTGWTTGRLLSEIEKATLPNDFNLVSLLIGVNDQYGRVDTGVYAKTFESCLSRAIKFAGNRKERVFVLSIPDYSVTPVGRSMDSVRISKEIDLYNSINKRITTSYQISYTNITESTRQAAVVPGLICSDALHPSGREYKKWSELLGPGMFEALK